MMTDHTDLLEQVFELNLNNYGPEDVERLNDWAIKAYAALEGVQTENAMLWKEREEPHQKVALYISECNRLENERDAALARLAEIEAGASPVEPSQALSLDLLERLSKTLTRLGYATPEGGMEHFNADLANQLYNLCRAVDSLFDREQPPAPSEAAREYMTGYSDGKELAAAPIPQQVAVPAECCEHCDDGDGLCVFPMYGPAPHTHDTSSDWIGSARTLPKDQWGNNFREDPDCEGHGVYMRCEKCGRGEQPAAAAPQPKDMK